MPDCVFCKIINKEIATDSVFETDNVLAFDDINPKAPTHVLIIPKKHIATVNEISLEDQSIMGELFTVAKNIAKERAIASNGYRLVMNCNQQGGQEVYHVHLHLIGGKQLSWPPGC